MDLDGDGNFDILSGSYSRRQQPMAGLFQVLWGRPDGTFQKPSVLEGTDGEPLIIPIDSRDQQTENICTRPFAVDWDGDGHLDLIVGNFAGTFYFFKGEGKGRFLPQPTLLMAGGSPLKIKGVHSDPFVVDWDGDGDLDILSGSSIGGVQWAENIAGPGKPPELKPFRTLIEPGPPIESGQRLGQEDLVGPAGSTRIWADDVNGDGKLDLLVGDRVTLVAPADGLSEEEFQQRHAGWQEAFAAASAAIRTATADAQARSEAFQRYQELSRQRGEFVREERTGHVWLYLRK